MPIPSVAPYAEISAEALIDGGDELFPKTAPDPVILRDDQSGAEPATRAFSKNLSAMVAAIASNGAFAHTTEYPRLDAKWEIAMLAAIAVLLGFLGGAPRFVRHIGLFVLAGVLLAAQWIGVGMAAVWLPALPGLAAICAAFAAAGFIRNPPPPDVYTEAVPMATSPPIEITPEPEPAPAPKNPRVPVTKTAAKKVPAKKAATPRKPRIKNPPTES